MKIAIIGAGISGISIGKMLSSKHDVEIFERENKSGGLVRCDRVGDNLFHRVGGHVFNSKNQKVLDWFWQYFDREKEFLKAKRNAKILLDGEFIGYPIENHLYQLDPELVRRICQELMKLSKSPRQAGKYSNFSAFLRGTFGETLYKLYFEPYNEKIWHTDLAKIPLEWLDGKLPMPVIKEIFTQNILRHTETKMVHSTFYYPRVNGSQFIIDRLSKGLNIHLGREVKTLEWSKAGWKIDGKGDFEKVVFCGDIRKLGQMLRGIKHRKLSQGLDGVTKLKSNGTSNAFCECDKTDISWLYLPGKNHLAHRIIYTGGFSPSNNRGLRDRKRMTCVVEFSGKVERKTIQKEIQNLPGNLRMIDTNWQPNSYVIHDTTTRRKINLVRDEIEKIGLYNLGRFAEWEYYNMDAAIEAAMGLVQRIK